jgi:proteasome assembly chaperone 3
MQLSAFSLASSTPEDSDSGRADTENGGFNMMSALATMMGGIGLEGGGSIGSSINQPPFPVKVHQATKEVQGVETELVEMLFSNMVFIIITQIGKIGTLIQVSKDEVSGNAANYDDESGDPSPLISFTTHILLGKRDEPLLGLCARQIAEDIVTTTTKSLLLGISLKNTSAETIREIVAWVKENRIWGKQAISPNRLGT